MRRHRKTEVPEIIQNDLRFPHCDTSILHAPGKCGYCDMYPDWQQYRKLAHIAFTGEPNEQGVKPVYDFSPGVERPEAVAPCPSTWFRSPEQRDHWGGNVARGR